MGHCHYITTAMTCTRSRGGEIHSDPFVSRTEQKRLNAIVRETDRKEKKVLSISFLSNIAGVVVVTASFSKRKRLACYYIVIAPSRSLTLFLPIPFKIINYEG